MNHIIDSEEKSKQERQEFLFAAIQARRFCIHPNLLTHRSVKMRRVQGHQRARSNAVIDLQLVMVVQGATGTVHAGLGSESNPLRRRNYGSH
jgi:hypothetical protein